MVQYLWETINLRAVFSDFHQGYHALGIEGLKLEVIEHKQVLPFDFSDFLDMGAVAFAIFKRANRH
jgi:hypothetical protein